MRRNYLNVLCSAVIIGLLAWPAVAVAQQKTVAQCNDEWMASQAAVPSSGKKKSDFMTECRAGTATLAQAKPAAPAAPPSAAKPGAATGTGQFATEAQAKAHCPSDTVVWANLASHVYHYSGNKSYGNTKSGAYMCEKDTAAAGVRAAKNEKRPG